MRSELANLGLSLIIAIAIVLSLVLIFSRWA